MTNLKKADAHEKFQEPQLITQEILISYNPETGYVVSITHLLLVKF